MDGWNTTFLLGNPIVRCYVSFREGTSSNGWVFHCHVSFPWSSFCPAPLRSVFAFFGDESLCCWKEVVLRYRYMTLKLFRLPSPTPYPSSNFITLLLTPLKTNKCHLKKDHFNREYTWTNHWFQGTFVRFPGRLSTCIWVKPLWTKIIQEALWNKTPLSLQLWVAATLMKAVIVARWAPSRSLYIELFYIYTWPYLNG